MNKISEKIKKIITIVVCVISFLISLSIYAVAFLKPQHNLFTYRILIASVIGTVVILFICKLWDMFFEKFRFEPVIYYIYLALLGILLFVFHFKHTTFNANWTDYVCVYRGAETIESENGLGDFEYYFSIYTNNLKPAILLSFLMKFADLIHVSHERFLIAHNIIITLLTIWGSGKIIETDRKTKWRLPIAVFYTFLLPMWSMVGSFYTDQMSFGYAIISLALLKCMKQFAEVEENKSRLLVLIVKLVLTIIAAIAFVWSLWWKPTSVIIFIAVAIIELISGKIWKNRIVFLFIAEVIVLVAGTLFYFNSLDYYKKSNETGNPAISWIGIGLTGNGGYYENITFANEINGLEDKQSKSKYAWNYIIENKNEFFNADHIVEKASFNFSSGNLGAYSAEWSEDGEEDLSQELYSAYGKYYWYASQYCMIYICIIYFIYLIGSVMAFIQAIGNKSNPLLPAFLLAQCGTVIFLMIWEASNRQLYNQMPVMITGAFVVISCIVSAGRRDLKK